MPSEDAATPSQTVVELVHAAATVAADLDLSNVLDRVVREARVLTGARYGALGVLGEDGTLARFVAHGLTPAQRRAIGDLPKGRGVLGDLVRTHRPLRLQDLTQHPSSVGFPPHHPPMHTFLGVPVLVRGEAYGNLYLTEKAGGQPFTEHDERLVTLLAMVAGTAIANARIFQESERRRIWVEASAEITTGLLGRLRPVQAVHLVIRKAREVSDADAALLAVGDADGRLVTRYVDGELPGVGPGTPLAEIDYPAMAVPFTAPAGAEGRLVVAWAERAHMERARVDPAAVESFAAQAGLALDRIQALADRAQLAVLEDRDRIARDLHDLVIQRLFATGLSLQAILRRDVDEVTATRVRSATADLDETIRDIRATIFALQRRGGGDDIRGRLNDLAADAAAKLGLVPRVSLTGPLASALDPKLADHVVAVVSEAFSNAARHANATDVAVSVTVADGLVTVVVTDDGVGMPAAFRESGLGNLRRRADEMAGDFQVGNADGGGTQVRWCAPLTPTDHPDAPDDGTGERDW